eukprot:scaffold482_cov247-Pinguiococcus_pyrenoidosus.AAC.3
MMGHSARLEHAPSLACPSLRRASLSHVPVFVEPVFVRLDASRVPLVLRIVFWLLARAPPGLRSSQVALGSSAKAARSGVSVPFQRPREPARTWRGKQIRTGRSSTEGSKSWASWGGMGGNAVTTWPACRLSRFSGSKTPAFRFESVFVLVAVPLRQLLLQINAQRFS